jgi:hypothetical protein
MNKIIIVLALLSSSAAFADSSSIVKAGFEALKAKGASEACSVWLHGSALEGDTTTKLSVVGGISQIEAAYGSMDSYEIVASYSPTSRLRRVYAVVYYAKGPTFYYFDLYKTDADWVVYMLNVNTKPQLVFPDELINKKANQSTDPTPAPTAVPATQEPHQG